MRLIVVFFLLSCTAIKKESKLHCVEAMRIVPMHNADGNVENYDTSQTYVYFKGDSVIYDFAWKHYINENGALISTDTWHRYVLTIRGSFFGIEYNSHANPRKRKKILDSLFQNEWICSGGELVAGTKKLTSSVINQEHHSLEETYQVKSEADTGYISTCTFLFTDTLSWLQLPYNIEINALKNKQLVSTTMKAETQFYRPINKVLEGYIVSFKFKEIHVSYKKWNDLLQKLL